MAADDPGRVTVVADWAAGEKARYVEERVREVRQQEQVREQVRVRIPLTVEVLERLADGYRLRLVYGQAQSVPPDAAADAALADLPASTLVIRLSSEGRITSLENWEALRDESLAIVRAKLQGQKSGEDLEAALARARALFATPEQATALFTRSVAMLFYPIGLSIPAGEVIESDDWVENPIGGERLPTKTFLKAASEGENHCRVTLDTHFQDEAFLIVQNSIAEYAQRADRGAAPPPARFSIEDHSEFLVDRKAGWVQQAEFSRTIISDDSRSVDRRQWTLATPAAPAPQTEPSFHE